MLERDEHSLNASSTASPRSTQTMTVMAATCWICATSPTARRRVREQAEPAPRSLAEAAAKRTLDAEQRVRATLRQLDADSAAVSFAKVAERARVSRAFLYAHPELRAEIEALRSVQGAEPARLPVRQRASDSSRRARLRAALDENQRQREEIAALREELALAHGRVRELELDRRVGRGHR